MNQIVDKFCDCGFIQRSRGDKYMLLTFSDFKKNAKVFLAVRFSETVLNIKDNLTFFFVRRMSAA